MGVAMKKSFLGVAAAALLLSAGTAEASNVGGFTQADARSFLSYSIIDGSFYSNLRSQTLNAGHTLSGLTGSFTSSYLNSIDVFFTGIVETDSNDISLSTAEQTALTDWVSGGGTLFVAGENDNFDANVNQYLSLFDLNLGTTSSSGGTWAGIADPLLSGISGGSNVGFASGGAPLTGSGMTVLASDGNGATVVSKAFGLGRIVATGDGNMFENDQQSIQFALNVFGTSEVSTVPVPAALPLLAASLAFFGFLSRRRTRP